ncbi:MAG TPA: transposase, partial [Candidatus Nanoarchaeia archaeon]|nr:transposase [Candidatus Nanoarchaeia archaeon]
MFIRKIKKKSGTYLAKVESYRDKEGKIKQRVLQYLGKEIDGKPEKRILTSKIKVKSVKRSMDVLAVDKISEELGLKDINNKYALSLVYSQLLEKRSIHKLENWMRYTEIPEVLGLKDISVKELYESLTEISDEEFEKLNSKMFDVYKKHEDVSDIAVIDITDTYFNGSKVNIKKRRGKEDKISKLIQVGLAVSFKNGFPIFYKQYQGNLHGFDIFKDMTLELKHRGLKSIIVDRGMLSVENLRLSMNLKLRVIAGLKKDNKLIKKFVSKIKRGDIYKINNIVKLKNTSVFIKTLDYLNGKLIVVYNPNLEVYKNQLNFNKGIDVKSDIGYTLIY